VTVRTGDGPIVVRGWATTANRDAAAAVMTLEGDGFTVSVGETTPWSAAYRDVVEVRPESGVVHLEVGAGPGAWQWTFERLGPALGTLVRGVRDGRLRQWLTDGLVDLDGDDQAELVEFAAGPLAGVASILYHGRGVAVVPLDERLPRFRIRRADIGTVTGERGTGRIRVKGATDALARGYAAGGDPPAGEVRVDAMELSGLGDTEESHRQRWTALRDSAAADIAAILAARLADAPFEIRRAAGAILREGSPADTATLGDAAAMVEASVQTEPGFAESYRTLVARAGGATAPRWIAMAPTRPGDPQDARVWFLVGLPGNLVALELVSAGAHATYFFRVAPRAAFDARHVDPAHLAAAVREVSEALVDARFLREPMALPGDRLAEPRYLRYRLAIAALPSLAAARARFVARIVHADPASWAAALDDLIRWHGSAREEEATWPGRDATEAQIDASQSPDAAAPHS
jgi:hypothetical protein